MKCDLTGQKFGKLTVVKETTERHGRYVVWLCRCDCGNSYTVSSKHLKRGTKTHCGCEYTNPYDDEMIGRTFGYLTVEERVKSDGKFSFWKCKCACGNTKIFSTSVLIRGKKKSCGSCSAKHSYVDLTGKQIGRLLVVEKTEQRTQSGCVIWRCLCECGIECYYSSNILNHGTTISCGCYRKGELPKLLGTRLHRVDGTCIERLLIKKARRDSSSGYVGIHITKDGQYRAMIGFKGKRYYLGVYDNLHDALAARKRGEKMHVRFLEEYYNRKIDTD